MKIELIACESLGVRSMATLIKTDVEIFIDPGIAIAPKRYGLPPHKKEIENFYRLWGRIKMLLKRVRYVVITHYHFDHFNPQEPHLFEGKKLFLKNPFEKINYNQRRRGERLINELKGKAEIEFSDGLKFRIGKTELYFSPALSHGKGRGGFVLSVGVRYKNFTFLHTSDIEGHLDGEFLRFYRDISPNILYLDGPSLYLKKSCIDSFEESLLPLLEGGNLRILIVDHHFMRDPEWEDRLEKLNISLASYRVSLLNGAQYMGSPVIPYEALRRELFKKNKEHSFK